MAAERAAMIMAGGRGTRLWPLSRRDRPKQVLRLVTDRTLVEDMYARVAPLVPPSRVFVIAEEEILSRARPLLPHLPPENFIAEPAGRDTWPCCLWGTHVIAGRLGEEVTVWALAADQTARDEEAFREALAAGAARAENGAVVTFGLPPTRAETGYGYLRAGEIVEAGPPRVRRGLSFTEKPDAATARAFVDSGKYLWNSGMFAWRADRLWEECEAHCADDHDTYCAMREAWAAGESEKVAALYGRLARTSVDYALVEKLAAFEIVEMDCGWDDIGSFESLGRVLAADAAGNVGRGDVHFVEARENVVLADGERPVVLIETEGLVVVDAGDVVLIYPQGCSQGVRRAVELMREEKADLV
ncbi:MAG: mannose-1-phosphate guanylyltransferase [Candidatus Coatesbacteria bacterium]|nr:MAG: mannose-1-phosphate guanylyltransferase [Candidatus Coatesbacteria bacterium]